MKMLKLWLPLSGSVFIESYGQPFIQKVIRKVTQSKMGTTRAFSGKP